MDRKQIIRMAREAGFGGFLEPNWDLREELERFLALVADAERNKLAAWMMAQGYATGHGDTVEDLLKELEWQIEENLTSALVNGVEGERKVIMDSLQKQADLATDALDRRWVLEMIAAVAARISK